MDQAAGEAETSYGYTVPGERRGQAVCLALVLGPGLWHRSPASLPAAAAAEGVCAISFRTLDNTVRVSGVRLPSTCEWNNGREACLSRIWDG